MSDRLLIALGISIVTGWMPAVQAQQWFSTPSLQSPVVTLSGESLKAIESRNTEANYQDFFPRGTAATLYKPDKTESSSGSFLDGIGIIFGSRMSYPEYMEIFNSPAEFSDSQSVLLELPFAH